MADKVTELMKFHIKYYLKAQMLLRVHPTRDLGPKIL